MLEPRPVDTRVFGLADPLLRPTEPQVEGAPPGSMPYVTPDGAYGVVANSPSSGRIDMRQRTHVDVVRRPGVSMPPPPAPQTVCLVNHFDPAWGVPPPAYRGLHMDFDGALGAYRFDDAEAQRRHNLHRNNLARDTYKWMSRAWEAGAMLQPYKVQGARRWRFRLIPRGRTVICASADAYSADRSQAVQHPADLPSPVLGGSSLDWLGPGTSRWTRQSAPPSDPNHRYLK